MTFDEHGPLKLYRCTNCDARWLLWPDSGDGALWNLLDQHQRPAACCDNAPMGEQIEFLRDIIPHTEPARSAEATYTEIQYQHAKKQAHADGFQTGWHAALSRALDGDELAALINLVPQPPAPAWETPATEPQISQIIQRLKRQPHDMGAACPCSHFHPKPLEQCQCWIGRAIEFLEAAQPRGETPAEPTTWGAIDTAPKDGTWILLSARHWGLLPVVGQWSRLHNAWQDYDHGLDRPTHWMPLPAPPKPRGETPAEPTTD